MVGREGLQGGALEKTVIFVLGMGRSGTSLLARVLSLSGGALPDPLVGAIPSNPRGHWEPQEALELNESFLRAAASSWFDPTPISVDRLSPDRPDVVVFLAEIRALLRSWHAPRFLVIKEPRITALAPIWLSAAHAEGFAVRVVIPVRHPDEVAMSLATRDGLAREHSDLLWLKNCLLAEQASRGVPRAFVDYRRLVSDWRREVQRMSSILELDFYGIVADAIDAFVTPALHREHRMGGDTLRGRLSALEIVYDAFAVAARADAAIDVALFDKLRDEFCANSAAWPVATTAFLTRLHAPEAAARADQQRERQRTGLVPHAPQSRG